MFKRFWWVLVVMLPVGAMAGFLVAAVITYVMPKKYESQATIEVKPKSNGESVVLQMTPQFFGTEFEVIKSRASLVKVIDHLELVNKWGVDQETAVRILKGIVTTENIRGTDLISIKVRHTDKEDARDIAAEVARAYRDSRKELANRDQERNLADLNKAVKDQEEKVEEVRKVFSEITTTRKKNISVDGTVTLLHLPDSQDYIEAKRDFETDQALLETLKLKQIGETIKINIPNESIVIHEEPQIARAPLSPNVTLNLILGSVIGFLLSPLLALPVMILLHRLNPVKVGWTASDPG